MIRHNEYLEEVFQNLKRNKLRTFLTGFAVAWGIIFLVILLGVGSGIHHGGLKQSGQLDSGIYGARISTWRSTKPYQGYPAGRWLYLDKYQFEKFRTSLSDITAIEDIEPTYYKWDNVGYQTRTIDTQIMGIKPYYWDYFIPNVDMLAGRSINDHDEREYNKVVMINTKVASKLFNSNNYTSLIGKSISLRGISMTIIGIFQSNGNSGDKIYIPCSTFQKVYPIHYIDRMLLYVPSVRTKADWKEVMRAVTRQLSPILHTHPEDVEILYGRSNYQENGTFNKAINGFYTFLWIVGLSTLIIGVVGVSNIMLVSVRERYKEIGIRKALGAKPRSIVSMILFESLLVTSVSGAIGLVLSVSFLAVMDYLVTTLGVGSYEIMGEQGTIFESPIISPGMAGGILLVMILAGLIAGYTPARRAVRISAIEAMRD